MNISGIRPISGFYSDNIRPEVRPIQKIDVNAVDTKEQGIGVSLSLSRTGKAFGTYDVIRQHKPSEGIKATGVDKTFSRAEVAKAVDVMKRDGALHKYQTFVGAAKKEPLIRQSGLENFTL